MGVLYSCSFEAKTLTDFVSNSLFKDVFRANRLQRQRECFSLRGKKVGFFLRVMSPTKVKFRQIC